MRINSADGTLITLYETSYTTENAPEPIELDITRFKGQVIQLEYETKASNPDSCYMSIWEKPRLILNASQP